MIDQELFDKLGLQDKENKKFVLTADGDVAVRVGGIDLSAYLKKDQTTPQETIGTFTFPKVKLTDGAFNGGVLMSDADGLADWGMPIATGGMKSWFFTKQVSNLGGVIYKAQLAKPTALPQEIVGSITGGSVLVATFISDILDIEHRVTDGARYVYLTAKTSSLARATQIYLESYICDLDGSNPVLAVTTPTTTPLTLTYAQYTVSVVGGSLVVPTNKRIMFKVYATKTTGGPSINVTIKVDDDTFSRYDVPSPVGVTDLTDYAELAIETTQDNLYTNLIHNNLLIPNQWYLITDFKGEYKIPGTSEVHIGLVATTTTKEGNPVQLYYDDGITPIVDGDPEEIYVLATSPNEISPNARSKTFPNELVTFTQNIPPITQDNNTTVSLSVRPYNYIYGYGDSDNFYNDYPYGISGANTSSTAQFSGSSILQGRTANTFSLNIYDSIGGSVSYNDANEGTSWTMDYETGLLTDLTGDIDFLNLSNGGYWDGSFEYPVALPPSGLITDPPLQQSGELLVYRVVASNQIELTGNISSFINRVKDGSFYFSFFDNDSGSGLYFTDYNEGTDWSFDTQTNILTDLTEAHSFYNIIGEYYSLSIFYSYAVKSYQGLITARENFTLALKVPDNYRSCLIVRYNSSAPDWVEGTSTKGTVYKYNNNLYRCIRETTTEPPSSYDGSDTSDWCLLRRNDYYFSLDMGQQIPLGSSRYCTYFNTNDIIGKKDKINLTLSNSNISQPFDICFCDRIISSTNVNLIGYGVTIIDSVSNSDLYLIDSVFRLISGSNIKYGRNFILDNIIYSNIQLIYYYEGYTINDSYIGRLVSSSINEIRYSNISLFSGSNIAKKILNTTALNIKNTYASGSFTNGYINAIENSNFYDETLCITDSSVLGKIDNSTFNYAVSNSTFKGLLDGYTDIAPTTNVDYSGVEYSVGLQDTDITRFTGRLVVRTLASNPLHATPASRPAGTLGEIAYYSGKQYVCTNASTPLWEMIQTNSLAKFGDITGGNYSGFEANGTLVMNGTATVFNDLQVNLSNIKAPAANPPTWTAYKSCEVPSFKADATNVLYFTTQLPHSWKEASDIEFHFHTAYPVNGTGNSRWQLTYSWANMDGTFSAPTTVLLTCASPNAADTHKVYSFGAITGTGKTISSVLLCSLSRLGADALDTYAGVVYAVSADFHYEQDTLGSRTTSGK